MFIDSVIWIAYKNKTDSWARKSKNLLLYILSTSERACITDYVVLETVYLSAKDFLRNSKRNPRNVLAIPPTHNSLQ